MSTVVLGLRWQSQQQYVTAVHDMQFSLAAHFDFEVICNIAMDPGGKTRHSQKVLI